MNRADVSKSGARRDRPVTSQSESSDMCRNAARPTTPKAPTIKVVFLVTEHPHVPFQVIANHARRRGHIGHYRILARKIALFRGFGGFVPVTFAGSAGCRRSAGAADHLFG